MNLNDKILHSLVKQRDELYDQLVSQKLTDLYLEEYNGLKDGSILFINNTGIDVDFEELLEFSKDKSINKPFTDKVKMVKHLNEELIIKGFEKDIKKLCEFILGNSFKDKLQGIFITHDHYEDPRGIVSGFGIQTYPLVLSPRYISSEYDYNNIVFSYYDGIDFKDAWIECQEFEFTKDDLEIGYDLERLFQLNSRILLHKAFRNMEEDSLFKYLCEKPLSIFFNQHDCEEMSLFVVERNDISIAESKSDLSH